MIRFDVGVFTDCGLYKAINEDSFHLLGKSTPENRRNGLYGLGTTNRQFAVAAVFDGMGGEKHGEIASGISAGLLTDHIEGIMNFGHTAVNDFVAEANEAVCKKSNELLASMGSTMVLAAISDERATIYNIGDSRAYLARSGHMKQLTKDHTVAASLSSIGITNKSEHRSHQLTQYLGIPSEEIVIQAFSMGSFDVLTNDKLLLCSDGVTEGLSDERILAILSSENSAPELAKELVKAAIDIGSKDNVTAMVFAFSDDGKPARQYDRATKIAQATDRKPTDDVYTPRNAPAPTSVPTPIENRLDKTEQTPPRHQQQQPQKAWPPQPSPQSQPPLQKDKFGLFWLLCVFLALASGAALGVIYSLFT